MWRGGVTVMSTGYVGIHCPDHPRASGNGHVLEHILVVEKAIGKMLLAGYHVHHWNEDKTDNRPSNLLICENAAYHNLIHQRQRAFRACGNADWLKCSKCKNYDDPINMDVYIKKTDGERVAQHKACKKRRQEEYKAKLALR